MTVSTIRQPAVAGMFYPAQPSALSRTIDDLLDQVGTEKRAETAPTPLALIVPHAGYMYSGKTAAYAYALLLHRDISTVVIVAPSHREYFDGISIFSGSGYRTPLGEVLVDDSLRDLLLEGDSIIGATPQGHHEEHAIEVQLPFLQRVLPRFHFLPIVMGHQTNEYCFHLGNRLGTILKDKNVLLIASSDLSHYYPSHEADRLDRIFLRDVEACDPNQLMIDLENDSTEACGGGPAVAVMHAAKLLGATSASILHHCNSGDITGDYTQVVGYVSAALVPTN
ncbi:MAG TPA: AmmeMemoRadiSam system protein B [Bacteroidota bacterium]|nr:AmmeMemoRadiSam system protein B [Bacteroidota bacterium]